MSLNSPKHIDSSLAKLRIDKGKRKQPKKSPVAMVIGILLIGGAAGGAFTQYKKVNTPIEVEIVQLKQEETSQAPAGTEAFVSTGYVIPRTSVDVISQIMGRVEEVFVRDSQSVQKGDVLIRLQDTDFRAQVEQAQARVGALEAQLSQLKAGSRPQEIESALADMESARAQLTNSEAELNRFKPLFDQKVVSAQELDQRRTARDVAKAAYDAAVKRHELVKIGPRIEEIAAAEARLKEARAGLQYAQTQLDYTIIRAPISGVILEKIADVGELVTNTNFGGTTRGAKTAVVTMADLGDLQVETNVKESNISKVKLDQRCLISLDTHPDVKFEGLVDEISPQADRQLGAVKVKIKILNPDKIRPDVNARVSFLAEEPPVEEKKEGDEPEIWVPAEAVDGDGVLLFVKNKALRRKVTVGREAGGKVLITDGLAGNERLIIPPAEGLKEGALVAPKK